MNLFHRFLILGVILFQNICRAEDFTPKVTRIEASFVFNIEAFDDSNTLLMVDNKRLTISKDGGESWEAVKTIENEIMSFQIDEFHSHTRAFASAKDGMEIYLTNSQGESWEKISFDMMDEDSDFSYCDMVSHPNSPDYLMATCRECKNIQSDPSDDIDDQPKFFQHCKTYNLVSKDRGKSFANIQAPTTFDENEPSFSDSSYCSFGVSSSQSILVENEAIIYCLNTIIETADDHKLVKISSEFYYTDDFGRTIKMLEHFEDKSVQDFQILDSHMVVTTRDDQFNLQSSLTVWISNDGKNFEEAYLPTTLRYFKRQEAYEDIAGRIIFPITTVPGDTKETKERGALLLRSDSSGLKFSTIPWASLDYDGFTQLTKSRTLPGTILGEFHSSNRGPRRAKKNMSKTKITTDNGATWQNLRVVDPGNKDLYSCDIDDSENCSLHSSFFWGSVDVPTAGIFMMVGTVSDGKKIDYDEMMTFISTDGGRTWRMVFEYPTQCAFGDLGNIILAMPYRPDEDEDPQSEFYYSLDHGKTWAEYQLEKTVFPIDFKSTTPDGSGLNFVISGFSSDESAEMMKTYVYSIDFSEAYEEKACDSKDFETWELAEGKCINGAKYSVKRRKQNSKCLVRKVFENLQMDEEPCQQCTEEDYECSFEFMRNDDGKCVPSYQFMSLSGVCANTKKKSIKLKPIQKISNNKCKKDLSIEEVDASCGDLSDPKYASNKIKVTENLFPSSLAFYQYFDTVEDESIIIATEKDGIYISHDSGQTIRNFDADDQIVEVIFNPYFNSSAYFFGASGSLYVTNDRGNAFYVTELPEARQLGFPLEFNARDEDTFIYYGGQDCDSMFNPDCHAVAFITKDGGETFTKLLDNAIHCEFAGSTFKHPVDENLIICQVKEKQSQKRSLVSSNDFFENDKKVLFDSIIGYMSTGDFLVVAVPFANMELRAYVTVDGDEFAEARFPHDYLSDKQESFTVLGSQTGAIFVHVSTSDRKEAEYGVLMKSNSNGTSFVALETAVNRNRFGMVDFEKVEGLEGIILVNTVANPKKASEGSEDKLLKSKITFNDGSDWDYLRPPSKDSEGKSYECGKKSLDKCSLHLHSYTEREDVRDTFSSGSAVGMLIGVGNVGEYLLPEDACSTFLSTDGGETWKELLKEPSQWEYGDHGSVIVLVSRSAPTDILTYSIDSGKTWETFKFTEEKTIVKDIVTVPRDSALRFLLITESSSITGSSAKTYSVDFGGCFERQCKFSPQDPDHDDFEFFALGASDSQCLFGHQAKYLKKIKDDCFVGNLPLTDFFKITKNCKCARKDFECDYNYYKAPDGTCKLVQGLSPSDPSDICEKENGLVEFFKPSGYRKIPLSTCEGGLKLDEVSDPYPCPGMEKEFNSKHGIAGRSFLLIFIVPFIIFVLVAWFVYERGIRRNGGFARFGEIRLNDNELIENNGTDKVVNGIIKSGLMAASGIFTGYQLIKRSIGNSVSKIGERMRGRRGPSYSSLVHDQFLDEADDLLAGHDADASDLGNFMETEGSFEIDVEDNLSVPDQIQLPVDNQTETDTSANDD